MTLNGYTEIEYNHIKSVFDLTGDKYILGREIAPTTGMSHIQGYVEFKHQKDFSKLQGINARIHWEKAKGTPEQNFNYCSKEGHFEYKDFPVPLLDPLAGKQLYTWQAELETILNGTPHDRQILWYVDPKGNQGKSAWAKHWLIKHPNDLMVDGSAADIKYALASYKKDGKPFPTVIIWDLAREKDMNKISYASMEAIKNGAFFSGKYESGMILMNPAHIVVLSNSYPLKEKLTEDRWEIKELSNYSFPLFNAVTLSST